MLKYDPAFLMRTCLKLKRCRVLITTESFTSVDKFVSYCTSKKNHKIDPWPQFYCLQILIFLEFNKNVKRKTIDFYFVLTFSSNLDLSSVKKLKNFRKIK